VIRVLREAAAYAERPGLHRLRDDAPLGSSRAAPFEDYAPLETSWKRATVKATSIGGVTMKTASIRVITTSTAPRVWS